METEKKSRYIGPAHHNHQGFDWGTLLLVFPNGEQNYTDPLYVVAESTSGGHVGGELEIDRIHGFIVDARGDEPIKTKQPIDIDANVIVEVLGRFI